MEITREKAESSEKSRLLFRFSEPDSTEQDRMGGKAAVLALLTQKNFSIPAGCVLTRSPASLEDWETIMAWWESVGSGPLAVRSSAVGEDSTELSFAGQQTTLLNVTTEASLRGAIETCFQSINRSSSRAYREHFHSSAATMNVVLQRMIAPRFSGVYFSKDPRDVEREWLVEIIEGLGEELVSGRRTPHRFDRVQHYGEIPEAWNPRWDQAVVAAGKDVEKVLGFAVDMEFCIDSKGTLWVLQARPITAAHSRFHHTQEIDRELKRLKDGFSQDVIWDGQTFAELTGTPSYLTFSIWKDAFTPAGSFGEALHRLGYAGSHTRSLHPRKTLLERVFGRAYVNLSHLERLFFGLTPYAIVPKPRPHLEFRWRRLSWKVLVRAPVAMWRMARVAWTLQSRRRRLLQLCTEELAYFSSHFQRPLDPNVYSTWETNGLIQKLRDEAQAFSTQSLHWPFVLIFMIEATLQSLHRWLKKELGSDSEANLRLQTWMGAGLKTITRKMSSHYQEACDDPRKRPFFLARYGHRGPGELDLVNPRWAELGDQAFRGAEPQATRKAEPSSALNVEDDIQKMNRFRKPAILQEWRLLREMLELREHWKMEILKPYAHLRWIALELGRRLHFGDDVFWLRLSELTNEEKLADPAALFENIRAREKRFDVFRHLSFPAVVTLDELTRTLEASESTDDHVLQGEPVSPGVAHGTVHIVTDPHHEDPSRWPEDTILVAEATDPGWTPLFRHCKAILVEKGGVLCHAAILAREMELPAVSGIRRVHYRLKEGMHVWVDGSHGRVRTVD